MDKWKVSYRENPENNHSVELMETFHGLSEIEEVKSQTYLGFVISSTGDNMAHIKFVKQKAIGVIRKISAKLVSLNLQKYYFECSMILLNAILRPSILYACDMMYNMKEREIRQIERIEENFIRKVLNTSKGCPIVQLYLEMGHIPARIEIQKMRCLFLHYILQQNENSNVYKMFKLQYEMPTPGDWASLCMKDLEDLEISESLEEIKDMTKNKFSQMLKQKVNNRALKYLTEKQRVKGKEIVYKKIEMAEYLSPLNSELTIEEKRKLFGIRNDMILMNFSKSKLNKICSCGRDN